MQRQTDAHGREAALEGKGNGGGEGYWRRRLTRPLALVACATQAACAPGPNSVEARYVSPNTYQSWTCDQLGEERARLTREVQRVSGLQRENANADAAMMTVGLIVFWPMLFGLAATNDRKDELGRLKGEYDAVDLSVRARQCAAPPPGVPGVPAPPPVQALQVIAARDGVYKGKGSTDAWCQTPALALTLRGADVTGDLSEVASGAPTSSVTGTLDASGTASLDFKPGGAAYFAGRVDGTLNDDILSLAFRSQSARACSYRFELRRAPLSTAMAP